MLIQIWSIDLQIHGLDWLIQLVCDRSNPIHPQSVVPLLRDDATPANRWTEYSSHQNRTWMDPTCRGEQDKLGRGSLTMNCVVQHLNTVVWWLDDVDATLATNSLSLVNLYAQETSHMPYVLINSIDTLQGLDDDHSMVSISMDLLSLARSIDHSTLTLSVERHLLWLNLWARGMPRLGYIPTWGQVWALDGSVGGRPCSTQGHVWDRFS